MINMTFKNVWHIWGGVDKARSFNLRSSCTMENSEEVPRTCFFSYAYLLHYINQLLLCRYSFRFEQQAGACLIVKTTRSDDFEIETPWSNSANWVKCVHFVVADYMVYPFVNQRIRCNLLKTTKRIVKDRGQEDIRALYRLESENQTDNEVEWVKFPPLIFPRANRATTTSRQEQKRRRWNKHRLALLIYRSP